MGNRNIRLFTAPNAITCLNLLAGCVGVTFALVDACTAAMICVLLAAVFDFLDGLMARLLKQYSPVGVQLDSLADMVSFGLVPALMLHYAVISGSVLGLINDTFDIPYIMVWALCCSPFILTVFSALRLAKFNVDNEQTSSFIGLPTPANALFFSSLVVGFGGRMDWRIALPLVAVFSFLMVSKIPMFSFKIKDFSVKKYAYQLVLVVLSIALTALSFFSYKSVLEAFAPIILLYIVLNLIRWIFTKKTP
jgi:CDP-diacylglycerol--serine O-phosphatidyltransferase